MWFLYFWGTSTTLTILLSIIFGLALQHKITNEYNLNKERFPKKSISERIIRTLPAIVPFVNCLFILIYIFGFDSMYKTVVERFEAAGYISKK